MVHEPRPPRKKRRRPFGVNVIIALQMLSILIFGGSAGAARLFDMPAPLNVLPQNDVARVVTLSLDWLGLIIVFGLWRLRRWAWVLVIIQLGLDMAFDLAEFFAAGERPWVSMLLNVIMVFYLNQREVRDAFERPARHRPVRGAS